MAAAAIQVEQTQQTGKRARKLRGRVDGKLVFLVGLLVAGSGIVSPAVALVGGVAFGFTVEHPLRAESAKLSKLLLQASVVALGFGMNVAEVVHAGRSGFAYTAISITFAMTLGLLLGRVLKVGGKASYLIAAGTAICGGSAIAAVAPITEANEEEISVSMGTVFLLNSVALLLFPAVGHWLRLDQNQFGLWAALAIHDTSSVVGAAAAYGSQALQIGTTVKLARALWIVPVSLLTAAYMARFAAARFGRSGAAPVRGPEGQRAKVKMPWFIVWFCVAAAMSTYLAPLSSHLRDGFMGLNHLGKAGLTATLFLIGTSLSKKTLQQVGVRPLVQGVVLWVIVGGASLAAIYFRVISI
jgi:uncharacterized integral membrane protein (TIGR00698 family)